MPTHVLGLSAYFHDSAAALVTDGRVVAAAQEERFTRTKHDSRLPLEAARFCLAEAGLSIEDVDHVVFFEKPLRKFDRLLVSHLRAFPRGFGQFSRAMATWLGKRLWLSSEISRALGCAPERLAYSEHHLSHAASAFFCSPFERAAVLTADGVGEWATTAIWRASSGRDGQPAKLELVKELHFPHSIGLLYSALTAYLGFEVNEGEYKVMGLASFGTPRYLAELERVAHLADDGAVTLDMRYFCFDRHETRSFTPALEALLGPARVPGTALDLPADDGEARRFADIAASLQALCERAMLLAAHEARRVTGEDALCLAGGVALNSVANGRIVAEGPFRDVYVHPAAGDAGGALGAALWMSHVALGLPRAPDAMPNAYLGRGYDNAEVERFLEDVRVRHRSFDDPRALDAEVARRLAEGEVGGWFRGRFEWGPRALGARSILADARDPGMVHRINAKVKFREPFRPFAPAVLADEAPRWFQLPEGRPDHLTPWMLTVVPVTDEGRRALPSVTHVDGTARVQSVTPERNPDLCHLLEAFRARTGVGCLVNTSMNLKGEPICATPADALSTFRRSDLDFLVLERCLVERAA